ncbi:hypothetical protein, partial [Enterococcus faecium]|uniref:hypothetical protein n=1 Tax=Enterococcus faecium TaxID=1352 RepID=UPI003CC655B6
AHTLESGALSLGGSPLRLNDEPTVCPLAPGADRSAMQPNAGERLDVNELPVQPIQLMTNVFDALLVTGIGKFE